MTELVFLGSLALSVVSSLVLAEVVDRIGRRFRLSEGLLGIVTALGADSPEISAAVAAVHGGHTGLGFGVVIGSNVFNVAALLALSAVLAGQVRIRRRALVFEGGVALAVTGIVSALVLHRIGPAPALGLEIAVLAPYLALASLRPARVQRLLGSSPVRRFLATGLQSIERDVRSGTTAPSATRHDLYTLVPALTAVVLGSIGMVDTSVSLGARWGISQLLIGTVVLAALTGLPNVVAAVRLALRRRGSAVVSEALNSNTINLLAGITLPALIVGVGVPSVATVVSVWWLVGISLVTIVLTGSRGMLRRAEGAVVIALYLGFVGLLVATS